MDRCNYALADYLANRGTETHIVAYRVAQDLAAHPNVTFHRVGKPLGSYFLAGPLLAIRGQAEAKRIAGRGGRVVANGGSCVWPDVNWVHHLHASYKPVVAASVPRKIKAELEFRIAAYTDRRAFLCARLLISTSGANKRELMSWYGIPEHRIHVVDLGVDGELFHPPDSAEREKARASLGLMENRLRVAFVGAIGDRRKGFDTLYAAWKILCADPEWDADLVVVGSGFELPAWRSRAVADGLGRRIRFLGFDPARDFVARVHRACDLLASPTRYEGYGLAILEAAASGLPVIVSRVAPVTDRFGGVFSDLMLSDPESVEELVNRFRYWHAHRGQLQPQAASLSDRLRRWTWHDMAARIIEVIESNP